MRYIWRENSSKELRRVLGRSLKLRQVSAGGCNGCEADVNVLNTIVFDLGQVWRSVRGVAAARGRTFDHRPRHAQHEACALKRPMTRSAAQDRDCRGSMCHFRRPVRRITRKSIMEPTASCPSIFTSPAVRRTPSRSSTGCCGCWASWKNPANGTSRCSPATTPQPRRHLPHASRNKLSAAPRRRITASGADGGCWTGSRSQIDIETVMN